MVVSRFAHMYLMEASLFCTASVESTPSAIATMVQQQRRRP